ncbi:Rox3 mediator complex subunit-domain-containing protein [Apodospora peruviana]|uniref:Mediator of RNA polymerase II transcription subunit 19 n=1 Tax=Apodospora peruviana TaxID=516989 RepID=A0AAE0IJY6_9PEZI|nr:Rox3 mediator complex subunit-domain-containing protein [Apodospora peruviana]
MSFHPQTPQSPSQLSPNTSDPTPLMSMTSSMTSTTTNTLPTPAHSVNGSSLPSGNSPDINMADDSPHKRKRPIDDVGDREYKKVQIEDRRLGIENLHLDVGEKYLLCRTPHPPSRPQVSEDLFEMYGLTGLASEVARVLPNGEKNAIRKTYKGHIKKLGVQGHWDSVKRDYNQPDSLLGIMKYPENEWNVHYVRGKDIIDGFSAETHARLLRASTMSKGLVPKSIWDTSVLGELGPGKGDKQTSSAKPTAPNTPLNLGAGLPRAKQPGTPSAGDANRPKRNIKKRGYGESTYEGYGEGYDDGAETGYSTGEGDMASGQKRRKKAHYTGSQPYAAVPQVRQQVY